MSRFQIIIISFILVTLLLFMSCAPVEKTQAPAISTHEKVVTAKDTWQQEWDRVVSEARKEGKVIVYSTSGPEVRIPVGSAFRERYGIPVEFVTGKGAEVSAKILSERRAGIYLADVYVGGATTLVNSLKPAGLLEPVESVLTLPEVINPQSWFGGKIGFIGDDHKILYFIAAPWVSITINPNLVKNSDINSWLDLLDTRWRGKIAFADPTLAGAALKDFGVWSQPERLGLDYFRQLAKQDLFIGRDDRQMTEGVARGKFPIGISLKPEVIDEFNKAGASLLQIVPKEGTYLMSAGGNMSLINRAPHPYAASVFINWLLSKEGQIVHSKGYAYPSARVDVPAENMDPQRLRNPSSKYFWSDTEEFLLKQPEQANTAKEIFAPYIR